MFQLLVHVRGYATFGNGQGWAPLITQDVQADAPIGVDVGVVDASGEVDLGGFEWIVGGEMYREEEYSTRVRTLTLQDLLAAILGQRKQGKHVPDTKSEVEVVLLTGPIIVACQ